MRVIGCDFYEKIAAGNLFDYSCSEAVVLTVDFGFYQNYSISNT
jgi:hypothetical protein